MNLASLNTQMHGAQWIVERLDSNFTEDFETRCSRTQDAFDIVRAGIAAREAIKNIKQEGGE